MRRLSLLVLPPRLGGRLVIPLSPRNRITSFRRREVSNCKSRTRLRWKLQTLSIWEKVVCFKAWPGALPRAPREARGADRSRLHRAGAGRIAQCAGRAAGAAYADRQCGIDLVWGQRVDLWHRGVASVRAGRGLLSSLSTMAANAAVVVSRINSTHPVST